MAAGTVGTSKCTGAAVLAALALSGVFLFANAPSNALTSLLSGTPWDAASVMLEIQALPEGDVRCLHEWAAPLYQKLPPVRDKQLSRILSRYTVTFEALLALDGDGAVRAQRLLSAGPGSPPAADRDTDAAPDGVNRRCPCSDFASSVGHDKPAAPHFGLCFSVEVRAVRSWA
jgi:hypothetical protein